MHVFLIHGMGRSPLSMAPLAWHLRRQGHSTSSFGYSVRARALDAIAEGFLAHVDAGLRARPGEPYAIVGHSLGNIITRVLTDRLPERLAGFVMLAPPNNSPSLARAFGRRRIYRAFTGDAGQRLGDTAFYAALPRPSAPCLIIAGNRTTPLLPYRGEAESDGIVSVDETRLEGVRHEVVPAVHSLIMNHPRARQIITGFLEIA